MRQNKGFTLIELMIVIVVLSILMTVAIPAYTEQMRKSRRSDAVQALSDLSLKQEKWRANHATYGSLADIGGSATLPSGNYTLAVSTPAGPCAGGVAATSANSFAVTASKAGAQASDTKCATMSLTNLCGAVSKTSTGGGTCW